MKKKIEDIRNAADRILSGMHMTEQDRSEVKKSVAESRRKRTSTRKIAIGAGALAAAACLIIALFPPHIAEDARQPDAATFSGASNFRVMAENGIDGVVDASAGFLIYTDNNDLTATLLKSQVQIVPETDFSVERVAAGEFLVKPDDALSDGTVYNLMISDKGEQLSWAFQVKDELKVISSVPSADSMWVPVNTGIEMTFSRRVSEIPKDAFSISPSVDGAFEYHGNTAVFVPSSELAENTVYTVTLKSGVKADSGDTLDEDYEFSFRTDEKSMSYGRYIAPAGNGINDSFLATDTVVMGFYADSEYDGASFDVNVYKLSGADEYLSLIKEYRDSVHPKIGRMGDHVFETDGRTPQQTFEAPLTAMQSRYGSYCLILPENPGAGWYLIDAVEKTEVNPFRSQKLVQISDAAVSLMNLNGECIVWVNSAVSGGAVKGADVVFEAGGKTSRVKTDAEGIARLDAEFEMGDFVTLTVSGEGLLFAEGFTDLQPASEPEPADMYYIYFYTDRAAYQPNDTVRFWGVVLPKENAKLPDELEISGTFITSQKVKVAADGSYSGEIQLLNNRSGYESITVSVDGSMIRTHYIDVMEYTKPTYVISAETDKEYYRNGETVKTEVTGTFFDGSPAVGVEVEQRNQDQNVTQKFGEDGKVVFTVKPRSELTSWRPDMFFTGYSIGGAEDVSVYTQTAPIYFRTDYMLRHNAEVKDGKVSFTLRGNRINYSAFDKETYYEDDYEAIAGAPYDLSGSVDIVRCENVKRKTGSYYDYINKVTVPTYEYDYKETVWKNIPFTMENGVFTSGDLGIEREDGVWYEARAYCDMPDGQSVQEFFTLSGSWSYPADESSSNYRIALENGKSEYALGETVKACITSGWNSMKPISSGRALVSVYSTDIIESSVIDASKWYSVQYSEDMIPWACITAVYFDGKHVCEVYDSRIRFNTEERELTVDITADKESYRPGEAASFTVSVKDANGRPVSAPVLLSVSDEAAFAIENQYVDPLSDIYADYGWNSMRIYASYASVYEYTKNADLEMAEGGGEGGGDGVRRSFKDTAAFLTGVSDKNGNVKFNFAMPDNTTSWRLTAIAVDSSARAGFAKENAVCTLPFYINTVLNEKYLAGDDIVLSLRTAGSGVSGGDDADYTVTVEGSGTKVEKTASGKAEVLTYVNLGKLEAGEYDITIRAEGAAGKDAIQKKLLVLDSLHEIELTRYISLSDGKTDIGSKRYPVMLTLFDEENSIYMRALSELSAFTGVRADQTLAQAVADDIFAKLYPQYEKVGSAGVAQNSTGGVPLMYYSDDDAVLTAEIAACAPDYISAPAAKSYFWSILGNRESTETEVAAAYMGLAALGEPVLADIRLLLSASAGEFSQSDRIMLARGLFYLGDMNGGREWYGANVSDKVKKQSPWSFIGTDTDDEERYGSTMAAAVLARLAGSDDYEGMMRYLLDNTSRDHLPALVYADLVLSREPETSDASVSYVKDGKTNTVKFADTPVVTVWMSEKELLDANITVLSGKAGAAVTYIAGRDELPVQDDSVKITKTFAAVNGSDIVSGGLVDVTVQVDFSEGAPYGWFSVNDVLPTGMRFVSDKYEYDCDWYYEGNEAGRVSFCIDRRDDVKQYDGSLKPAKNSFTIKYRARCVLPGTFRAEGAVVTHAASEYAVIGADSEVTVK